MGLCEDRVVFGNRTGGMIVGWENYYNEELNNLYCALNVIPVRKKTRKIILAGNRSGTGVIRNV
jgi:hypothetical protein